MKQKDRELLLKDIYARIPYGVKGCCEGETICTTPLIWYAENTVEYSINYMVIKNGWRPYLFPLSSMSEEVRKEFNDTLEQIANGHAVVMTYDSFDCLNKHHIDYRGLIPKGLAINATELNIY